MAALKGGGLRILIVGSGGREHALFWKISQSPLVARVYVTPGNAGIAPENRFDIKEMDLAGIVSFAVKEGIDLVVVGPEAPLAAGLVDELEAVGVAAFGPDAAAAELEADKEFMKLCCDEFGIPTAPWRATSDYDEACALISSWNGTPVIKARGLCGGKGVFVPRSKPVAMIAAKALLVDRLHGEAGARIVVEDKLVGDECSYMVLVDGGNVIPLEAARDAKRLLDGDKGPNTGGMGARSPLPDVGPGLEELIMERAILPMVRGMYAKSKAFMGLLYAGLMLTEEGPKVLEYNVRFGDPETQPLMMRLKSDLVPYLMGCTVFGGLAELPPLEFSPEAALCRVLAAKGYPEKPELGYSIGDTCLHENDSTVVFHAGTRMDNRRGLVNSGGRVFGVTSLGKDHAEARERCAARIGDISFNGMQSRTDL